jgi:hypothetical protein
MRTNPTKLAKQKIHRDKNRILIRQRDFAYRLTHREEIRQRAKEYRRKNLSKIMEKNRINRRGNIKELCRERTRHYVARGTLLKPSNCSICSIGNVVIHAHHPDYSKPREVVWTCHRCHENIHHSGAVR